MYRVLQKLTVNDKVTQTRSRSRSRIGSHHLIPYLHKVGSIATARLTVALRTQRICIFSYSIIPYLKLTPQASRPPDARQRPWRPRGLTLGGGQSRAADQKRDLHTRHPCAVSVNRFRNCRWSLCFLQQPPAKYRVMMSKKSQMSCQQPTGPLLIDRWFDVLCYSLRIM